MKPGMRYNNLLTRERDERLSPGLFFAHCSTQEAGEDQRARLACAVSRRRRRKDCTACVLVVGGLSPLRCPDRLAKGGGNL